MTPIYPGETPPRRRVAGAGRIMNESVFVGVYPGFTEAMPGYLVETINQFVKAR
jgi:hypothetical protein